MIKSLLFDAYGTLFNTKNKSVLATNKILLKHKINLDPEVVYSEWKNIHKNICLEIDKFIKEKNIFIIGLDKIFKKYNIKGKAKNDVKIILKTLINRDLYPEVSKVLNVLRNTYKIYIASNTDTKPLLKNIKQSKLKLNGIFTSEKLKVYKPNEKFFLLILKKLKLKTDEVIYIGDSDKEDIHIPQKIGIKSIWINRKNKIYPKELIKPYYEIKNIEELLYIL